MDKLTEAVVRQARDPGLIWDHDPKVPGFGVRIFQGGSKSFFLNYRLNGRQGRKTIGTWPTWSVEAARAEAKELRRRIDKGEDPARQTRERREAATIQDLIERYLDQHLPSKRAAKQTTNVARRRVNDEKKMLDEIATRLGKHTKVADIHQGDIESMHRGITDSGRPVRANRILAIASKMFSLALKPLAGENRPWRDHAQGNPCKGVEKNQEYERERFFSEAELAAISDALAEYPGVAADCVRLIMFTGCRPTEAMGATWEQFDNEPGFWIKPAATTKQRKTHKLPLSPPALELIERLRSKRVGPWVFPGRVAGEPLVDIKRVWQFVRKRARLGPDARVYDLRHSFASIGAVGGLSLLIIGRLLGHSQARTTARYAHLADDPVREAAKKITAVISRAGQSGAAVVPIKSER